MIRARIATLALLISTLVCPAVAAPLAPATSVNPGAHSNEPVHVEGPHVLLTDEQVTVLWAAGDERHEVSIERGDTIDIPAWRGTPAMTDVPLAPPVVGPSVFEMPERMLVLGDIHGRYDPFIRVLRSAGVIDEQDRWTFGANHLVCCGDLLDRGPEVAATLWLLHRLEREAAQAGGAVHVLLGNHEYMVIKNDLRYLHPSHVGVAAVLGVTYPQLYGPGTLLGRWLRTKHSIIRIGDLAFAHGGIGPTILKIAGANNFDHDDINRLIREHIDDAPDSIGRDPMLAALFGYPGPLWHRGFFIENDPVYDPATDADLDRALEWLGARAIAVGHTQFDRVGTHREGRVIATDVNLERTPEAVLIQGSLMLRVTANGTQAPLRPLELN